MRRDLEILAGGLAAIAIVAGTAQAGEASRTSERHGRWVHECGIEGCQAFLSVSDEATGRGQVSWSFLPDEAGDRLAAILTVPLGAALQPGIALVLADGSSVPAPFQYCAPEGCQAVIAVDDAMMRRFETSGEVQVQFVPYGRQYRASFALPTDGIRAATDKLRAPAGG